MKGKTLVSAQKYIRGLFPG